MHRMLHLIRLYDDTGQWGWEGHRSCAAWLSWRTGLESGAARERVRVARALAALPLIDAALSRGELSYSKVRAMTRVATPEREAELLEVAKNATAHQLEVICRLARQVRRERDGASSEGEPDRYVTWRPTPSGMVQIVIQLLPDEAATVWDAINHVRDTRKGELGEVREGEVDGSGEAGADAAASESITPSAGNGPPYISAGTRARHIERLEWLSAADAVMRMAGEVLAGDGAAPAGEGPPRSGGDRHEVSLHLTREMFGEGFRAELDDGTAVPAETFRRVACDAALVPHLEDDTGQTLDVGRRTRSIPPAMRRALRARQPTCAFPSCSHRRFLDAHHVEHWLDGGETKLSNLVHLCRVHHRLVHEDGYTVELGRDGQPQFRTPAGVPIVSVPSRPRSRGDVSDVRMDDIGEAADIPVHPDVRFHSYPTWSRRVDYDACVSVVVGH
jgi:hypothetical protein